MSSNISIRGESSSNDKIFLSFWNVCLSNFPVGMIKHAVLTTAGAQAIVNKAYEEGRLICVSQEDLLAPFNTKALDAHRMLCKLLQEHFNIKLNINDFCKCDGEESQPSYFTLPLDLAHVNESSRLIVVDCSYVMKEVKGDPEEPFQFEIYRDSIVFHLFEYHAAQ